MRKSFKNRTFSRIIRFSNLALLFINVLATVLIFLGTYKIEEFSIYDAALYISYALIPFTLITILLGFIIRAIRLREQKLNILLFILNIPLSFLPMVAVLYQLGELSQYF